MTSSRLRPTRLLAMCLVGLVFLIVLMALAYARIKFAKAGMSGWISQSVGYRPVKEFGIQYVLRILVPIYFAAGVMAWLGSLLPGLLARPVWWKEWKGREALAFGLSALLWMHLVLWWQVPSALWVIPGVRVIPFWMLFPLLAILALAYPLFWLLMLKEARNFRRGATLACWLITWTGLARAPQWLPRPRPTALGGDQPCKVLFVGVDGLRSDVALRQFSSFKGTPYKNAYTVIPATRMLWHILWGGDPMTYTVGHVAPSLEEFERPRELSLLRDAKEKGWKPRFYIDDGGTIGTVGRHMDLDDALMPATGWENFVNSNLAVSFPLYAVWENWFKPFPTTNPWASLDEGLKEALRLGRGSGWVMFHSCLAHQPIFLTRGELNQTGSWWALAPSDYEPVVHIDLVTQKMLLKPEPRTNTFKSYEIRMASILEAWKPIWNALDKDPQYRGATRALFSDHGERFHNVTNGFQLQGVHGMNLDPWECRVAMLMAGPGFSDLQSDPREETISILGLRNGVRRLLSDQGPFDSAFFEGSVPTAPMRYHTIISSAFGQEPFKFRAEPEKKLAMSTYIGRGGIWFTKYDKSVQDRAADASVAYAKGADLRVFKPLEGGGAKVFNYRGYNILSTEDINEPTFQEEKRKIEALLIK